MSEPKPYQFRHIFTEGRQCGSPALRGEKLCFYHHASRRPAKHEVICDITFIALPAPEDLHAIQRGLCEVLRLLAANRIDDRHASTLLRGLSIASANLARIARLAKNAPAVTELVQDFVQDPILGTLALGLEPESSPQPPLPDCVPLVTPVPTIEYIRTPEAKADATARWAKLEQELADYALAHPKQPSSRPIPVPTYPPANEDFGPAEKIIFTPPPTPGQRARNHMEKPCPEQDCLVVYTRTLEGQRPDNISA